MTHLRSDHALTLEVDKTGRSIESCSCSFYCGRATCNRLWLIPCRPKLFCCSLLLLLKDGRLQWAALSVPSLIMKSKLHFWRIRLFVVVTSSVAQRSCWLLVTCTNRDSSLAAIFSTSETALQMYVEQFHEFPRTFDFIYGGKLVTSRHVFKQGNATQK